MKYGEEFINVDKWRRADFYNQKISLNFLVIESTNSGILTLNLKNRWFFFIADFIFKVIVSVKLCYNNLIAYALVSSMKRDDEKNYEECSQDYIDIAERATSLSSIFIEPRNQLLEAFKAILSLVKDQGQKQDELRTDFMREMQAMRNYNECSHKAIRELRNELKASDFS